MAAARELVIADEPAAWARLGFAPSEDGGLALGGLRVRLAGRAAGEGIVALAVDGLARARPDGLPIVAAGGSGPAGTAPGQAPAAARPGDADGGGAARAARASPHANGARAVDHVVVFTDDRDRTAAALAAAGGDVRRRGQPPELPAPMAFVRFGELIVEVAQAGGPPRFWGLTVTLPDLDAAAGPLLGAARPAVQAGRRIATVSRAAGLSVALAFITPRREDASPARSGGRSAQPRATR
jgi:hypothetical protein